MNSGRATNEPQVTSEGLGEEVQREIRRSLEGLQFGSVLIIVQDGKVVQIDRIEKKLLRARLPR